LALAELLELRLHLADGLALPLKKLFLLLQEASLLLQKLLLRLVSTILLLPWENERMIVRQIWIAVVLTKEL
jgi:hypothetical protein